MNRLLCLALLVSMATIASAFLSGPCPIGCADSSCMAAIGCTNCQSGWCRKFVRSGSRSTSICVQNCGEGMYCYTSLGSFCTSCGVDNCSRCSERYKCEECKRGYEVKPSVVRDSCERKRYG